MGITCTQRVFKYFFFCVQNIIWTPLTPVILYLIVYAYVYSFIRPNREMIELAQLGPVDRKKKEIKLN